MLKRAYPDRASVSKRGDGRGFIDMRRIIHDFLRYNEMVTANFLAQLESALSSFEGQTLRSVAAMAESMRMPLYMVGGFPRDLVLGRPPTDFDLVVEGNAVALASAVADRHGGEVTVHTRFGTAEWRAGGSDTGKKPTATSRTLGRAAVHLDFVTARSESYSHPGALPQVSFGSVEDDLRRRDFTINTLAIRLDGSHFGEIFDPLGALTDIRRRIIEVLHDDSFRDDPTRMYRAVRYEKRLGFHMSPETVRLIPRALQWVKLLSPHRVRQELDQVLNEDQAPEMVERFGRLRLLRAIHPALPSDQRARRRLAMAGGVSHDHPSPWEELRDHRHPWILWLLCLSPAQVRSVNQRLHFDGRLVRQLDQASQLYRQMGRLKDLRASALVDHLADRPLPVVATVHDALPPGQSRRLLEEYLLHWRHVRPHTTGSDLKERGLPPGPTYRSILKKLRAAWIDGIIRTTEEEHAYAEKLVRRIAPAPRRKTRSSIKHRPLQ